ncbi:hypothetical protein KR044_005880, partial [Drosophila immigrans]
TMLFATLLNGIISKLYFTAVCGEEFGYIGIGRAFFIRWSYDQNTNTCVKFSFGGVAGNNNSFESEEDCISKCVE